MLESTCGAAMGFDDVDDDDDVVEPLGALPVMTSIRTRLLLMYFLWVCVLVHWGLV